MVVDEEVVWLKTQRRWAFLVSRGAWYSVVHWRENDIDYEDTVENDDYEFWTERAIEFNSDD